MRIRTRPVLSACIAGETGRRRTNRRHSTLPGAATMVLREADPLGSQEQVAAVAARMGHGLAQLASDIRDVVEAAIPSLHATSPDKMLEASIRQNVENMLGILARGTDPAGIEPPAAA